MHKTAVYHRNFGVASNEVKPNEFGSFVTTALFPNSAVAIRKSALDQTFLPRAAHRLLRRGRHCAGAHWVFVGRVAPIYQGVLTPRNTLYPGLAPQIYIDNSFAAKFVNQRTTGT